MKKYNTVIFDLDGTLLNTLKDLTDATNYALEKYGQPQHSIEDVRKFVGNGIRKLIERALEGGEENPEFEHVFAAFKEYYGEHCNDTTCLYPGVEEIITSLKGQGYRLAIVSNKADFAVKELQQIYFKGKIEVAIGEKDGIRKKPAPDTVMQALKELGSSREEAVYVGDSDVDIATAANSGMPCISVTWGFRDVPFLKVHGATHLAASAEELYAILDEFNA